MPRFPNHPQRVTLNDEAHARPFEAIRSPARLSYLAYLNQNVSYGDDYQWICELCQRYDVLPPVSGANHFAADFGAFRCKWARHSEFTSITFTRHGEFRDPFNEPALLHVPEDRLKKLPGEVLTAVHAGLEVQRLLPDNIDEIATEYFRGNDLIGARIGGGAGAVFTDFRVHADGFSRFLISDTHLGARQAGRMLQRLFEIDTYRMLAFLALPLAKSLSPQLSDADRELTAITLQMSNAAQEDEPLLLDQLTKLAAKIEASLSASDYRFSAAHAYYSIVERRISELRESRMQGMQPFREFMERRLTPAMDTCESISRRQRMLAERIDRASDLLRTRVDITREQQNQQLLEQMNKRSQLQLRLQETVEGLSVAAITYYSVGLVGYASKGLKSLGVPLNPDMAMGLAIPLIAGSVWYSIRAMRKVVAQEMGHH